MERFLTKPGIEFEKTAAHFGVSQDNLISSCPAAGTVGFEIGQAGLIIVGQTGRGRLEIKSRQLFHGAYANVNESIPPSSARQEGFTNEYIIPDEVVEFAKERNVKPIVVVRVGITLLDYAERMNAGPNVDLEVHRPKKNGKAGKLDSRLKFAISAMNTVVVSRHKAGLFR